MWFPTTWNVDLNFGYGQADEFQGTVVDMVTFTMVQAAGSESYAMLSALRDPNRKEVGCKTFTSRLANAYVFRKLLIF